MWSPHTATDITKLEALQRRSARWAIRDYRRTFSVAQMIKDLNWRTLEQRRIDSRLTRMYKITYDLVTIPAADYLIPNTRQSRHNRQLAYRQIRTLKDYYKYTFFSRTTVHWNALPFYIPVLPTVAQFSHVVCQVVHVSPQISEVLLSFNYTNSSPSLVYFFLTIHLFYSANPPCPPPHHTPPPNTHTHTLHLHTEPRLMSFLVVTCFGVPDYLVPHAWWRYLVLLQEGMGVILKVSIIDYINLCL